MPQLINVLKGEMSLVGPRPEMPFIVARYHPVECKRLVAKPGITGLWQISPARAFPIHENLQYDLHYIRNQNLLLDCAIIVTDDNRGHPWSRRGMRELAHVREVGCTCQCRHL